MSIDECQSEIQNTVFFTSTLDILRFNIRYCQVSFIDNFGSFVETIFL